MIKFNSVCLKKRTLHVSGKKKCSPKKPPRDSNKSREQNSARINKGIWWDDWIVDKHTKIISSSLY